MVFICNVLVYCTSSRIGFGRFHWDINVKNYLMFFSSTFFFVTNRVGVTFSLTHRSFTEDEASSLSEQADNYEFQAEVSRLLQIIVNSLYKTRDIFLRELISNGNDAIDKIRYQSLTDKSVLEAKSELDIRIQVDRDAGTLTIVDSGIGMMNDCVCVCVYCDVYNLLFILFLLCIFFFFFYDAYDVLLILLFSFFFVFFFYFF